MGRQSEQHLQAVEIALVALRRRQSRRSLARLAGASDSVGFEVLDAIEEAEEAGEAATVTGVAAALGIDQPRASRLVAAAVSAGLVRRKADQADGRRIRLVRTAAGRRTSEGIHAFRREAADRAMAGWPDADRAAFARLLTSFVQGLNTPAR